MPVIRFLGLAGCACALVLLLDTAGAALAQAPATSEHFNTCRRLGNLPGTRPMRRCIERLRAIDLDPLSALSEPNLAAPESMATPLLEESLPDALPGASSAEALLEASPEHLLLGPDWRAPGQGIYE